MRLSMFICLALALGACGEDNPVRKAITSGSFDLTLADYKQGTSADREEFLSLYLEQQRLPKADLPLYVACMGDYAATKSETLEFSNVFSWCQGDAERDRPAFEEHFNELDARDLSAEAAVLCRTYVKTQLEAPGTADFPFALNTSDKGRWRYLVNSYVDAQNAFGAQVRTYFTCEMQFSGNDGDDAMDYRNWDMVDFQASQ